MFHILTSINMLIVTITIVFLFLVGFRIAQEYERALVFRFGRFKVIKGPGLFWISRFIEREQRLDIRRRRVSLERQKPIRKESVTIKGNGVLGFKVTHPEHAVNKVANYERAV